MVIVIYFFAALLYIGAGLGTAGAMDEDLSSSDCSIWLILLVWAFWPFFWAGKIAYQAFRALHKKDAE